jgi:glycosyltransferase involved in cell wall biosynthesis
MEATSIAPPKVSVIVPAYNASLTIAETLQSIFRQSFRDFEIIVVDDGSTDGTADIVRAMVDGSLPFKLLTTANRGPSAARNEGFRQSSGEFIAPLDADDIWHETYLLEQVAALTDPKYAFSYTLHRVVDENGRVIRSFTDFGCQGKCFLQHMAVNFVGNGSSILIRRAALVDAGLYDGKADQWGGGEDYLLQLRLAASGMVSRVGACLVGYRKRAGSQSSNLMLALRSQKAVLDLMSREVPGTPGCTIRWSTAMAFRSAAAISLTRHEFWAALKFSLKAAFIDPIGTAFEFGNRVCNMLLRKSGLFRAPFFHPTPGVQGNCVGIPFVLCDATDPNTWMQPDLLLRRRLNYLKRHDQRRQL